MDESLRRRVEFPGTSSGLSGYTGRERSAEAAAAQQPLVRDLRRPRSAALLDAVHRLDVEINQAARADLARWIREAYEHELGDIPLGFVAQCHLGPPYVDHILDLFQNIVEHYAPADRMPDPHAQARMLVRTGAYAYVEIWGSGAIHPVLPDGTVVI
ncbi:hypothetical protein Cs7R123_62900 [Catellatospora sp. TT07R-123]|uniref:hypothetical protein n=1 Tax=Catellatospora sp. TT07R-123 TaxID=2733863 RepID=UPI001B27281A|nr:hypothetical protein [Catellatospora sp. TT07R-123]GHJ48948.1 hypothetical protein Cs7R123_62900 [Catellatospora sp. TT07R-123]